MDDFLKSEKTPEAAVTMQQEMTKLLASGGFRLTKWLSNSRKVLEGVPASERALGSADLSLHPLPTERTLGVVWNSEGDTLSFRVTERGSQATKREVLRQTASVFDPLGIGAPFMIRAKILMQQLWTLELEWDQCLPDSESKQWKQWLEELQLLKEVAVPRCIKPASVEAAASQFHVFCDASEAAFGAVIYLRTTQANGEHHCSFVISKNARGTAEADVHCEAGTASCSSGSETDGYGAQGSNGDRQCSNLLVGQQGGAAVHREREQEIPRLRGQQGIRDPRPDQEGAVASRAGGTQPQRTTVREDCLLLNSSRTAGGSAAQTSYSKMKRTGHRNKPQAHSDQSRRR